MREFEHPNLNNFECPVCKSSKDLPVVLVPIPKTKYGNLFEAKQVHTECYRLFCKMNDIVFKLD